VCKYTCIFLVLDTFLILAYACVSERALLSTCMCVGDRLRTCMCVGVYVYMYIHTHSYGYVYMYIHIHLCYIRRSVLEWGKTFKDVQVYTMHAYSLNTYAILV